MPRSGGLNASPHGWINRKRNRHGDDQEDAGKGQAEADEIGHREAEDEPTDPSYQSALPRQWPSADHRGGKKLKEARDADIGVTPVGNV